MSHSVKGANADYYYPSMHYSKNVDLKGNGDFDLKDVDDPKKCDGKKDDNGNGDGCYTLHWVL